MISLILEFVHRCNKANVTPSDKEIDAYLMYVDRMDLKDDFIKFCFYNWEKRNDNDFINELINEA
jgi:hypothetical protein